MNTEKLLSQGSCYFLCREVYRPIYVAHVLLKELMVINNMLYLFDTQL
jgi:hypothetical protein